MHISVATRARVCAVVLGGVSASAVAQLSFSEAAAQVGLNAGQVFPAGLSNIAIGGIAAGDFNRDGWQDLFFLTAGGAPDMLFINNGDGTFTDRAAEWGVAETHIGVGIAVGDYDNDGWLDVYVTSLGSAFFPPSPGHHKLYHNEHGTHFTEVAAQAGVQYSSPEVGDGWGATFGDYDLDGDLDLFVTGYVYSRVGNRLFRNEGDGTFTDVTAAAFPYDFTAGKCHGFSPRFVDMNGDRWPELLYVGDFHTSHYFINNGDGTFGEATVSSGTGLDYNGMGHTVADLNGDGLLDWYVTAIYTVDNPFQPGNMLYMNLGNHHFVETSESASVKNGQWGWGTTAIDIDHDGDVDLIATNGWTGGWATDPTHVWLNDGSANFVDVANAVGLAHNWQGRGLLAFDPDNDGDEDIAIYNLTPKPLTYWRNDLSGPNTHWLKVWLNNSRRTNIAPDGFGAKLWLTAGGKTQLRHVDFGDNYTAQNELSAHFGLGANETIENLRVEWPNGEVTELSNLAADQSLTVFAATLAGDITGDGKVDLGDLGVILSAFGSCDGDPQYSARADLNGDGCAGLSDLGIVLSHYGETL